MFLAPEVALTPSLRSQLVAQRQSGYGPITLRREGMWAIVEIEYHGRTVEVIREIYDDNFSHTVEPLGIQDAVERTHVSS